MILARLQHEFQTGIRTATGNRDSGTCNSTAATQ